MYRIHKFCLFVQIQLIKVVDENASVHQKSMRIGHNLLELGGVIERRIWFFAIAMLFSDIENMLVDIVFAKAARSKGAYVLANWRYYNLLKHET